MKRFLLIIIILFTLPSFAAIAAKQTCMSGGASGTTSLACSMGGITGIDNGDSVYCSAFTQSTTETQTITISNEYNWKSEETGYPKRGASTSVHFGHMMRALGADRNITLSYDGAITGAANCATFAGSDLDYIEQAVPGVTGTGTSISFSITTTHSNDVIIIGGGILTGGVTFTGGTGVTILNQRPGGSQSEFLAMMQTTTAGAQTFAVTASSSGQYNAGGVVVTSSTSEPALPTIPQMSLTGYVRSPDSVGANQGVARSNTKIFTTACYGNCASTAQQFKLTSWTIGGGGLPGTVVESVDVSPFFVSPVSQVNGIYWDSVTNHLFVTGMDYAGTHWSGVIEVDADNIAGGAIAVHPLATADVEGCAKEPTGGNWFCYFVTTNNIYEYNTSWTLVRPHAVPVGPAVSSSQWQACVWEPESGYVFCNPHDLNADHNVYVYSYDQTTKDFSYRGKFQQVVPGGSVGGVPDSGCGQGMFFYKKSLYWACRWTGAGSNPGSVIVQSWDKSANSLMYSIP